MAWDPTQYVRFAGDRERPFHDLLARVGVQDPGTVLDVGCGPGTATVTLCDRWPSTHVVGLDSSPEMIARAKTLDVPHGAAGGLRFDLADAHDVDVSHADLVVSNAMLQWLPDHRALLASWADSLRPGAWLAFQVPGNFDAPSHRLMRETAAEGPWAQTLHGVLRGPDSVDDPADYAYALMDRGLNVDAWETTYLHWLTGEDPVLEWVKGTGLRPVLTTLQDRAPELLGPFIDTYAARLREAYPAHRAPSYTGEDPEPLTAFAFRRIFVVARKP